MLVRAVLAPADVHLYAPKPTAFLGIVTPAAKTTLPWASSAPGSVRIGLGTQGVLRAPDPFEVDVACADLVIVSATYNARESITKAKLLKRSVITDGAPLAPAPGAKPVAEMNVGLDVELVETRGAQARILVDRRDVMVSGWVSQKDLGPPSETEADKGKFRPIDLPESPWLLMEKDARLLVESAELEACRQDSPGF